MYICLHRNILFVCQSAFSRYKKHPGQSTLKRTVSLWLRVPEVSVPDMLILVLGARGDRPRWKQWRNHSCWGWKDGAGMKDIPCSGPQHPHHAAHKHLLWAPESLLLSSGFHRYTPMTTHVHTHTYINIKIFFLSVVTRVLARKWEGREEAWTPQCLSGHTMSLKSLIHLIRCTT